jgi:DNA-binding XRE family transcriptional regulator
MERQYSQEELLEAVGIWLRTTIKKLENESAN